MGRAPWDGVRRNQTNGPNWNQKVARWCSVCRATSAGALRGATSTGMLLKSELGVSVEHGGGLERYTHSKE